MVLLLTNHLAGVIGFSISIILWIIALWRVIFHLVYCKEQRNNYYLYNEQTPTTTTRTTRMMTPRRVFHALLWLAMTLESVAYADMAGWVSVSSNATVAVRVGYVLLEVIGRAIFEFWAFSTVTFLWLETAKDISSSSAGTNNGYNNDRRWWNDDSSSLLPRILFATGGILSAVSIWDAIDVLAFYDKERLWLFRGQMLVESIAWSIQAVMSAICTWLTALRISRLSTLPQNDNWTTVKVVSKPLIPMILCGLCYTIRSIWLLCLFATTNQRTVGQQQHGVVWWIGCCWIPTLVPSTMLLYSARKRDPTRDQLQSNNDPRLAHPLLPTPVPPMEAFVSFRKFRENHDFLSPLSPFTTTMAADDPRADDDHDFEPPEGECRQLD